MPNKAKEGTGSSPHRATLAVAALAIVLVAPAAHAQAGAEQSNGAAATEGGWTLVLAPYVWATGIEGEVGIRGRTAAVDLGFGELIEKVDGAFYLATEARKRRWGIATELMLIELSDQAGTPGPLFSGVEVSAQQTFFELTPRYRIFDPDPVALDVILGARLWALGNKLRFTTGALPTLLVEAGDRWIDPVLGLRAIAPLGERWLLQARGDVGGFEVGSRLTWQVLGLAGFRVGDAVRLGAGYRHLDVDFENEDDGFVFDVGLGGLILGATIGL